MTVWLTTDNMLLLAIWLSFTVFMLVFVVPEMAGRRICRNFGLMKVFQDGQELYAVRGPDGKPVKIPIGSKVVDGVTTVVEGYAPLAWTMPYIAGQHAVLGIKNSIYGKAGKMTQEANRAAIAGMPIDQASTAIAMDAFAKGNIGKALMALLAPKIKQKLEEGMAGGTTAAASQATNPKNASGGGQGFNPG